jgi:ribonuclease Z
MKAVVILFTLFLVIAPPAGSQEQTLNSDDSTPKVMLLGTRSGPAIDPQRAGIGTLIVAGPERLLFDVGRGVPTAMSRMGIMPADVTKVFLTHLHSDHVIDLPELYLYPWASQGRTTPFEVWGPDGTKAMMQNLQKAFAFDIRIRRDVDEKYPGKGIKVIATDIREGVVYQSNGVKVNARVTRGHPRTRRRQSWIIIPTRMKPARCSGS